MQDFFGQSFPVFLIHSCFPFSLVKLPTTVQYKNSSGFLHTNFSVKHRPFLYLFHFVLAIKPLLFLYIVVSWLFSVQLGFQRWQDILFCNFLRSVGLSELQMCMAYAVASSTMFITSPVNPYIFYTICSISLFVLSFSVFS